MKSIKREIAELNLQVRSRGLKEGKKGLTFKLSKKDLKRSKTLESLNVVNCAEIQTEIFSMIKMKERREHMIDHVSKDIGKHNMSQEAWDKVCKIRYSPIETTKKIPLGDERKVHVVVPKGSRGYIIKHPESFVLSKEDLRSIEFAPLGFVPVALLWLEEIVFLKEDEYKIVPPFFDVMLASSIQEV